MVNELQLPIKAIPECPIRLGDGYRAAISLVCPKVKLVIQGANFEVSLFPFDLPGVEIDLGVSWLKFWVLYKLILSTYGSVFEKIEDFMS